MPSLPFALTLAEVCKVLGVNPNTFTQSMHPLFVQRGEARKLGNAWAYDSKFLWQWELYIATRKNLIESREWKKKRPYSIQDLEDIAVIGMYEDYQPQPES